MDKVFCINCEHFVNYNSHVVLNGLEIKPPACICNSNIIDTPIAPKSRPYLGPNMKNINNDCKDFKKSKWDF
jgi:hypothetical protein